MPNNVHVLHVTPKARKRGRAPTSLRAPVVDLCAYREPAIPDRPSAEETITEIARHIVAIANAIRRYDGVIP